MGVNLGWILVEKENVTTNSVVLRYNMLNGVIIAVFIIIFNILIVIWDSNKKVKYFEMVKMKMSRECFYVNHGKKPIWRWIMWTNVIDYSYEFIYASLNGFIQWFTYESSFNLSSLFSHDI